MCAHRCIIRNHAFAFAGLVAAPQSLNIGFTSRAKSNGGKGQSSSRNSLKTLLISVYIILLIVELKIFNARNLA